MGFSSSATYKKWSAGIVMRANVDNYLYNNVRSSRGVKNEVLPGKGFLGNASTEVLATNFKGGSDRMFVSDYWIENASFLRCDNINVGYNFGKILSNKADLRVTANVSNVFIITKYKGYDVIGMPPPSSGGIILAQLLKMVDDRNLPQKKYGTVKSVQLMIEAERRAYADRSEHMGDPDFVKVPLKTLISDEYINERMKDYDGTKASLSKNIQAGEIHESEETTHISIIDQFGNMVSITTTLNDSYGSKKVVSGAGFLLNNEMDDFSIKPGVPNLYGAVGGKANAIAANKRMLSSMTPTLVLKNKKPFLVVGSPGGTTIPTSVFQSIVNIIDFNLSAVDAVNLPKFHHQWLPDEVFIEKDFNPLTIQQLKQMGYKITTKDAIGRVELLKISKNKIEAVADKRGDDSVAGF